MYRANITSLNRTCTNLLGFATCIPFILFDYSHESHLDVITVFFSFLFLFQFCGFKIIAKINKFTFFKKLIKIFYCEVKKNCFKKIDGHSEGFSISIVWLWTSPYPQEDLPKFLVQMGEKSRKNLLILWTCKILWSKYDHIKKTFIEISRHWGTFSRTCCSAPLLLS
jgi:hypothetical protein